ncbi:hypothetical protein EAF00_002096 [Botryotinia globosa]|nr:hypothetical protein EAF00_002096 [Botryotinia globosa]
MASARDLSNSRCMLADASASCGEERRNLHRFTLIPGRTSMDWLETRDSRLETRSFMENPGRGGTSGIGGNLEVKGG